MELIAIPLVLLFLAAWIGSFVYWIVAIVEVAKIPEHQFRAVGSEKTSWILIVALAGIIGALIWLFAKRRDVLAAAGLAPLPPPGWYPSPATGAMQWWDGRVWVETPPAPPP